MEFRDRENSVSNKSSMSPGVASTRPLATRKRTALSSSSNGEQYLHTRKSQRHLMRGQVLPQTARFNAHATSLAADGKCLTHTMASTIPPDEKRSVPPPHGSAAVASAGDTAIVLDNSNFANVWVDRRTHETASSSNPFSHRVPVASSPTKKWWTAHPSAKIKHRTFQGSKEDAMVLATKLRKQLRADPDSWSDSHSNPVLLPNITRLVADGRASEADQFKLSQGLAPPRQFSPRFFGQNPEYSVSANREAIDWFDNHPQPSFATSTSATASAPPPSRTQPTTTPYQPSTYAMVAPFSQRMSTSSTTPQWIMEVQQGLPVMHAVWA
jgi:hypothetical protein